MDELMGLLLNGVATVTFTKQSDGSERVMPCTLNESLIPASKLPKGSETKEYPGVVRVFALDVNDWRAFRRDSVISYADGMAGVELCSAGNS